MSNVLTKYKNGNYYVTMYDDGTKIIENNEDYLEAEYPDNFDCKITNYCPMGCPMCHEKSTKEGKHGNIMNLEFFNNLHYGTEVALGGGMVTSHPDLVPFLKKLKERGIFPNITVHQSELEQKWDFIKDLVDKKLIYGIGVSFHHKDDRFWIKAIDELPNMVIHLIAGYHKIDVFDYLSKFTPKILILGYKDFGRGHDYLENSLGSIDYEIFMLEDYLFWVDQSLDPENQKMAIEKFKVVSFDNLSIEQLHMQKHISKEDWNKFYQGNDGSHTMYIDAVNEQFALNSTSNKRYCILNDIKDMFKIIEKEGRREDA
ncbi:radical SAM protein [uncultured Clostridium sp.]|uniref:radical SAM protein n=1 Tax=uncultured Clostridium sp. TaxID=59620 RepID=UPI0026131CCF|nr:radical SAM protein [uncultured Clostridium sp.]